MSRNETNINGSIALIGPTASGKTELAIHLAKQRGATVISADSRQVYAGMNIGTAKASSKLSVVGSKSHEVTTPEAIDDVEHYLLNVREPNDPITLADWQQAALTILDQETKSGVPIILAGGTMLYVDSIVKNYAIPNVPINNELRADLEQRKVSDLWQELISRDPHATQFMEQHNKRRIIRALETMEATGVPFSLQRKENAPRYHFDLVGLFPGWDELEHRITNRASQMFNDGLLDEVNTLAKRYGTDPLPGPKWNWWQSLNYSQPLAVLQGDMTQQDAMADMIRANLRYARRQMRWWRGRDEISWFKSADHAIASGLHQDSPSPLTSASPAPSGTE